MFRAARSRRVGRSMGKILEDTRQVKSEGPVHARDTPTPPTHWPQEESLCILIKWAFYENRFKPKKYAHPGVGQSAGSPDFQKSIKDWSEPINLYSFSCRIRFWTPNRSKTYQGHDFDKFSKKSIYHAERNMGMKPSKIWDLWTPAWGSKAALKKLSFTRFWTAVHGLKVGWKQIFVKIRFV